MGVILSVYAAALLVVQRAQLVDDALVVGLAPAVEEAIVSLHVAGLVAADGTGYSGILASASLDLAQGVEGEVDDLLADGGGGARGGVALGGGGCVGCGGIALGGCREIALAVGSFFLLDEQVSLVLWDFLPDFGEVAHDVACLLVFLIFHVFFLLIVYLMF